MGSADTSHFPVTRDIKIAVVSLHRGEATLWDQAQGGAGRKPEESLGLGMEFIFSNVPASHPTLLVERACKPRGPEGLSRWNNLYQGGYV